MDGPRIAVIGSPWRRTDGGERVSGPEAEAHEKAACTACEELGRELAGAGCRLIVYSAEEHSIEPHVVRGFVSVQKTRRTIEFRHPRNSGGRFPEQTLPEEPIRDRADPAEDWVPSFYRSLKDADGLLLLGGRTTVMIAGHVAIAFGLPVAAVAAFDGAAGEVWKDLKSTDLNQEEFDVMGTPWGPSSAAAIVASLVRRHAVVAERRRAEHAELAQYRKLEAQRKATRLPSLIAFATLGATLVLVVLGMTTLTSTAWFWPAFVAALTLAGVTGAGLRFPKTPDADLTRSLLYGAVAGFVFSVLYLFPQWAGDKNPFSVSQIPASLRLQILIAPILAIAGGMAAESVLAALQKRGEIGADQMPMVPVGAPPRHEPAPPPAEPRPRPGGQGAEVIR
jgi:hypothetical protein